MEPPFLFDPCKGARPDGTHVIHELVKDGWCWWYRKYTPGNRVLENLEIKVLETKRGLWVDPRPVPPWECLLSCAA
jgi:micrococcal nuclease